jgi:hypothetical protein
VFFAVSGDRSTWPWFGSEWVEVVMVWRFMKGGTDKGKWCRGGWRAVTGAGMIFVVSLASSRVGW